MSKLSSGDRKNEYRSLKRSWLAGSLSTPAWGRWGRLYRRLRGGRLCYVRAHWHTASHV